MHFIRTILIFCLLFLFSQHSKAQTEGAFQLEAMTEGNYYWQQFDFSITTGFGFNYWFTDHVAMNYEFQFGGDSRHGFTFNTGWGQVAAGFIYSEFSGTGLGEAMGTVALLALLIPEGLTFAINPDDELVFMPYIMPLEATYLHNDYPRFRCSGEVGLKMHWKLENGMALRPKIGLRCLYSKYQFGIEVGIGMMLYDSESEDF